MRTVSQCSLWVWNTAPATSTSLWASATSYVLFVLFVCVSCCCCCTGCATNTWSVPHDLDSRISLLLLANSLSLGSMHLCVYVHKQMVWRTTKNVVLNRWAIVTCCDLLHGKLRSVHCLIFGSTLLWCSGVHYFISLFHTIPTIVSCHGLINCVWATNQSAPKSIHFKDHFDIHFNYNKTIHCEWPNAMHPILEKEVRIEY